MTTTQHPMAAAASHSTSPLTRRKRMMNAIRIVRISTHVEFFSRGRAMCGDSVG